ncbi:glycerol-3-phosphate acyltransferase 1, mitochondrial isoform X2 [Anoplophora glabripennis]|uniref:glycerol-3-phosphate acyltransferase 1, mitochondrial isoform X2 n=1 Tax=Anoplophora glabripennis TaxID=217634 RepID=UPI0008754840|nr:glycerol-3-phosphate acyltransferase 1, mitochondrial isoform X2 [Anoplophora glabripennis]
MVVLSGIFIAWTMESVLEFSIFVGFLYWAFPGFFSEGFTRVNKMVDVVTNRVFDTYNRFSPLNNNQNESLATLSSLKRFARDQKFKKALTREADIKAREAQLFDIKEHAPEVHTTKKRPFMGLCCQNCTLTSRESLVSKTTESLALRNILNYQLPQHSNGFLHRTFSHLYQVYELKKFDYPQVADLVWKDERLKRAIEKTTIQQFQDSEISDDEFYSQLLKGNQRRARKLLYDMRSTLSDFLLRFTSWVLYKLLSCFLTSVVVHPGQVEMLKKAGNSNLPVIFLPLHRSHLDYILISFILLNNNIRSPLVAAGDNLRIPFFGSLLRGLGAFFIRRRMDPAMGRKDYIYKAVLHTYMNNCLRAGHNMEFFLEGGRTRTGKPCMPKYGILSVILDTFMDGTIEDALLVPISVNYEKLVDGNFIREQLGKPKEMETFGSAIKGIWSVLNSNYGMMRIDFNQPFSLRELVKTFNMSGKMTPNGVKKTLKSNPSTTSLYGTDIVSEELKTLVESISKHIIYDCAQSTCIMSTNALAFLLLTKHREGASIEELVNTLDNLRKELEYAGRDIGFSGDSLDVINYAVDMLGPALVRKERTNNEEIIKPIAILPNVIELTYYSNTVVPHFALESIVAIAIGALDKSSGSVVQQDLVDNVLDLCDILQYEFLFCKPCQSLEQVVSSCIDDLVIRKQIFLVDDAEDTELNVRSRKLARQLVDDGEEEQYPEKVYKVNPNKSAVDTLSYLRGILMPLVESYSITAFALDKLVGRQLLESELIKDIFDELKMQLSLGTVKYDESISVDPIKNALKVFQKWGTLECHSEKKLRLYYLRDDQDDSESVKALYHKVNKYRQSF